MVGSGCSFSEIGTLHPTKWLEQFGRLLGVNNFLNYNMARGGSGNEFIKTNALSKLNELINKGINPSDIFVTIQWTGYERCDLFVSEELPTITDLETDFKPNYLGRGYDKPERNDFGWVFSGAHINRDEKYEESSHQSRFQQEYLHRWYKYYYTHQGMWVNTLNNILFIQNFCKSHNIDYVFCTAWNLVQDESNKMKIPTFEQYSGFKFLWDMIDFDRFIFYPSNRPNMDIEKHNEREISDYGGMWQYMVERDGIDLDNRHPNEHGSKIWAEYILDTMKERKLL